MASIINNNLIHPINEAQGIVANASILLQSCGEEKDKKIILKEVAIRINSLFGKKIKGDSPSKNLSVQQLAIRYVEQYPILHPFFSELFPKMPFPTSAKILGKNLSKEEVQLFSKIYTIKISQHLSKIENALNHDVSKESVNFIENQLRFVPIIFKAFPKLVEDAFKKLCIIYMNSNIEKRSVLVRLVSNEISSHLNPKEKQLCFSILKKQESEFSNKLLREIATIKESENTSKDLQSYAALPEDILDAIFSYLPISDILECVLVCKIWNQVIHPQANSFLWKKLVERDCEVLCFKKELKSNQECFLVYRDQHVFNSNLRVGRHTLQTLEGHDGAVNSLVCSPNGAMLASGAYDNKIRIWDITTKEKKCVKHFRGHASIMMSLVFSPDETKLCAHYRDKKIKIWDTTTGAHLNIFKDHDEGVVSFAFSPDGSKFCCGFRDGKIQICDIGTGFWSEMIDLGTSAIDGQKRGHDGKVRHLTFSPDGSLLCSGSSVDHTIKIWNIATKECIRIFAAECSVWGKTIAFSPNGKIVCIRSSGGIQFWDITKGELKSIIKNCPFSYVANSLIFSPNGRMLCANSYSYTNRKGVISFWDSTTGECLKTFEFNEGSRVSSFTFNPDGSVFCAGSDHGIKVWDTMTGICLHTFADPEYRCASSLNFSPDGRALYFTTFGTSVKVLNFDADSAQILLNIAGLLRENTRESIAKAMQRFETLSLQKKNSVYEKLSYICNPSEIFHLHYGKHLFYGQNGFSSTAHEKAQAIELYLNESSRVD